MADAAAAASSANAATSATTAAAPSLPPFKKGSLVRVNRAAYAGSLEASASDGLPGYVIEGPGEILAIKGAYAQLRWRRPVPDVWLRLDQLEAFNA